MTPLAELLDRLRRRRQPARGCAAATVAVPVTEPDIAAELAPLFGQLDEIDAEAAAMVAAGGSEAATIERDRQWEFQRILERAAREAELVADRLHREGGRQPSAQRGQSSRTPALRRLVSATRAATVPPTCSPPS